MHILVTGVEGFIGWNIAEYLYRNGYSVIGHCRKVRRQFLYSVIEGDLSEELAIVDKVDCIVHAAGGTPKTCTSEEDFYNKNIRTTKVVVDYMKKYNIKKSIYISSTSVYGEVASNVLDEGCPHQPSTLYGFSKLEAEHILENVPDISAIALEPTVVIGNLSEEEWLVRVIKAMLNNREVTYTNKGGYFRCVHIDELCSFIGKLLECNNWDGFQRILVSCKDSLSTEKVMEYIKSFVHSDSVLSGIERDIENYGVDISKAYSYGYIPTDTKCAIKKLCEKIVHIDRNAITNECI